MSSANSPSSWPPDPDQEPLLRSVDENYVSEFLSEKSPEFEAVRQAAAEARVVAVPDRPEAKALPAPAKAGTPTGQVAPMAWLAVYAGAAVVVLVVVWLFRGELALSPLNLAGATAGTEGVATLVSRPEGADVWIDGERRGVTPLQLTLPVGTYTVELRNARATRTLTMVVDANTAVRESVDLTPAAATTGRLEISSDTPGAAVAVNGMARGVTPLVIDAIEPGTHRIAIGAGSTAVYRTVVVEAGATATVVASAGVPSGASGGWVTFTSPIEMQVIENGQVLGTTRATRLMLPAGRRELELVADPYEFRTTATALVGVGRTITLPVSVPNGRLSINAVPWAEVWLNGESLGSTPLANLAVPIGDHEVTWRHPQFGERRQTVRVPATTPARVGVDFSR